MKKNLLYNFNYGIWKPSIDQWELPFFERYEFEDYWPRIEQASVLAIDFETQSRTDNMEQATDPRNNEAVSVQVTWKEGDSYTNLYIPFKHTLYKFNWEYPHKVIEKLFGRKNQTVVVCSSFEYDVVRSYGVVPQCKIEDIQVQSWLWDENVRVKLKILANVYLGWDSLEMPNLFKKEKYGAFPPEAVAPYACQDTYITYHLWEFFNRHFDQYQMQLFHNLEVPINRMLCEAKWRGMKIDLRLLSSYEAKLNKKIVEVEEEIKSILKIDNPNSSSQLLGALRREGCDIKNTNKDYLRNWLCVNKASLPDHVQRAIGLIRPYRYLKKSIKDTFINGKNQGIKTWLWDDGCIRPNGYQWSEEEPGRAGKDSKSRGTVSGRFSYSKPAPNVFIKEPKERDLAEYMAKEFPEFHLRRLVIPTKPDYLVLCGDLSQIEMRTTASASHDQYLIDFYNGGGGDLYVEAAMSSTGKTREECSKKFDDGRDNPVGTLLRNLGKFLSLASVYGAGAGTVARQVYEYVVELLEIKAGTDPQKAEKMVCNFVRKLQTNLFKKWTGVGSYHNRVAKVLERDKQVRSRLGRTRRFPSYVPGAYKMVLQAANFIPQSNAVEICKLAMIQFESVCNEQQIRVEFVANIHDEIVSFCHKDDILKAAQILYTAFKDQEWLLEPAVKIECSISCGLNWADQVEFHADGPAPVFSSNEEVCSKLVEVKEVFNRANSCVACDVFKQFGHQKVYWRGDTSANVAIIGANPGKTELEHGRYFVGKSGKTLRDVCIEVGLDLEESCIIGNALLCYSPNTEGIKPVDIKNCSGFLHDVLNVIQPEAVLCLGSIAQRAVLNISGTAIKRGWYASSLPYKVFVTNHPAGVDRDPSLLPQFKRDLKEFADYVRSMCSNPP